MPSLIDALPTIRASADPSADASIDVDGLDPFGAMIAALLARQMASTAWKPAVEAMADHGLLDPIRLDDAGMPEIQDALKEKVRSISTRTLAPIKQLARWVVAHHDGDAASLADPDRSTDALREELAGIRGIGTAGADALLLTALKRPAYPVDRGTYRILVRHGWLDSSTTYEEVRDLLVHQAGADPDALIELSEGMEALAARYCRASAPRCDDCPLRPWLPEGGPIGGEE